jgi:hypothetical protein
VSSLSWLLAQESPPLNEWVDLIRNADALSLVAIFLFLLFTERIVLGRELKSCARREAEWREIALTAMRSGETALDVAARQTPEP